MPSTKQGKWKTGKGKEWKAVAGGGYQGGVARKFQRPQANYLGARMTGWEADVAQIFS